MATGYTSQLEDMKYDVKRWLKEGTVRAMGVCGTLRDHGTLTEEEIKENLVDSGEDSYYTKRLEEAQAQLAKFEDSSYDWESEYNKALLKARKDYNARVEEFHYKKVKHSEAITKVAKLKAKAQNENELIFNTLKFSLEQLESAYEYDYNREPYRENILDLLLDEWKKNIRASVESDVKYYTENAEKEAKPKNNSLKLYENYVKFVNENS